MPRWDLNRLVVFTTVARAGSLKQAAALLGQPQPAISRQIARLEEECRGRLFGRTGRGMALTEFGQRLLPQIERVLFEADALGEQVADTAGMPFGDVRLGVLPSLYRALVMPLFFDLRAAYPGITLHIFEGSAGQIDQWLASGHIDIGLPYRYGQSPASEVEVLATCDSFLVGQAGDALTRSDTVPFGRLDGLPLVLPSAPSGVRVLLDQLARRAGIALNVVVAADSNQLQKAITAQGGAYTVLPRHAIAAEWAAGSLQAARIVDPVIARQVVLATTAVRPLSLAARTTAKALRAIGERPETQQVFAG